MAETRLYGSGKIDDHKSNITAMAMHLENTGVAQVSELPDKDGFMIRCWEPGRAHEYGGFNLTALSIIVRFDTEGRMHIEELRASPNDPPKKDPEDE